MQNFYIFFYFRDEEGKDLLGKRTMDFKVSYLDAGFATSYFDSDSNSSTTGPKLNHRRYKTQLRDFLSSCRTKRKPLANDIYGESGGFPAYPTPGMYPGSVGSSIPGYPSPDTTLYMQQNLASPAYQSIYPGVDNRYLAATDYFTAAGYRSLGSYYPEYAAHAALGNGYLDVAGSGRIHSLAYDQKLADADKLYSSSAAAAYMSDPRLCSSLRLPDNKNGKDRLEGDGKLVVKEEGGLNPEYSLNHDTSYTLPDQIHGINTPVLYMCPESPKLHFDPRQVHSPSVRLNSPAESPRTSGDPPASSSSPSSSFCTFSLSDICGVAAISTDSVSQTQEVQPAHTAHSTN